MTDTRPVIAVLGAGAWGTALSALLARNGHPVWLWDNNADARADIARARTNTRSLPDIRLPAAVEVRDDIGAIAAAARHFLIAAPSHAFRATLASLRPGLAADATIAWATKGLEPETAMLLSRVLDETLGAHAQQAVVSGPTFAVEIARGLPSALVVASGVPGVAAAVAGWLHNDRLRVYTSDDVAGVQLGGAIKNVIAIAAGISDGLGFGANARAALITRGLAELTRLGVAMGGKQATFMGLAGAGDLVLTCTDDTSRNRRVGLGLGQGRTLKQVLAQIGQEAEGVATARALYRLARTRNIEMPITEQVYRVLYENLQPQAAVEALFRREPRSE